MQKTWCFDSFLPLTGWTGDFTLKQKPVNLEYEILIEKAPSAAAGVFGVRRPAAELEREEEPGW